MILFHIRVISSDCPRAATRQSAVDDISQRGRWLMRHGDDEAYAEALGYLPGDHWLPAFVDPVCVALQAAVNEMFREVVNGGSRCPCEADCGPTNACATPRARQQRQLRSPKGCHVYVWPSLPVSLRIV